MNYPKFHHKHLKILCKSFWHSIQWILSLWMYLCNLESCRKDTQHSYCKFGGRTATQFAIQNAFKVTFHHRLWKQKTQLCGNLSHFASAPTRGGTQHISTQYLHQRAPSLCIPYITAYCPQAALVGLCSAGSRTETQSRWQSLLCSGQHPTDSRKWTTPCATEKAKILSLLWSGYSCFPFLTFSNLTFPDTWVSQMQH